MNSIVCIAGQSSRGNTRLSYQPPYISSIRSSDFVHLNYLNVNGGDEVTLVGRGFGPNEPEHLNSVIYSSPSSRTFSANCTVMSDEEITCITSSGFGTNMSWIGLKLCFVMPLFVLRIVFLSFYILPRFLLLTLTIHIFSLSFFS